MHHFSIKYKVYFTNWEFLESVIFSLTLLVGGIVASVFAVAYATEKASNPVADIVLSNIPVFDVGAAFVYGTIILTLAVIGLSLFRPQWIPFVLSSLGIFYIIRAGFMTLTHLGPFPDRLEQDWGRVIETALFMGGNDLFFSGHTGAPFLLALIFWRIKSLRYFFLGWSIFFAIVVLLGHVHYSIDVAAAYFITYTIFQMAKYLLPHYRRLFHEGLPSQAV